MKRLLFLGFFLFAFGLLLSGCANTNIPADTTESAPPVSETEAPETEAPETETPETERPAPLRLPNLPTKFARRTVRPTEVTPTLDGVLTEEEWGDTADFHLDRKVTGGKRTYCLDQYSGDGKLIPEVDYFWRYDDEYVYVALRAREPETYTSSANVTYTGAERAIALQMGDAYLRLTYDDEGVTDALGNMAYGYALQDGVRSFEFAARRSAVTGTLDGFLGHVSYEVTVLYERHDGGLGNFANLHTRSTPMYKDESFQNDLFVLEKGTPAPAPEDLQIGYDRSYTMEDVSLGGGYTLQFGDPVVLAQGDLGDQIWGHYNFPELRRYTDGSIVANWSYHRDTIYASGDKSPRPTYSISRDNGETWVNGGTITGGNAKNRMKNGKYFTGFSGTSAYKATYLNKYTPALTWGGGYRMFFAEDVVETQDKTVYATEFDPVTWQTTRFEVTINWPYMPICEHPGSYVYPIPQVFSLNSRSVVSVDGTLYLPLYCNGFDSFAASREEAVKPYSNKYSIFFFKSEDNGRTWDLVSQLMTDEKIFGASEGLCEPEMTVMPDGSFLMLMRTGGGNPSYLARSTDRGETWSELRKFDDIGVLPQLLTLDCGVTLASYGRPTMRFAATADPDGASWTQLDVLMSGGPGTSCYYTDLLALDENTALWIYSDSLYPNENGAPVRTVLVRTVTVIPK